MGFRDHVAGSELSRGMSALCQKQTFGGGVDKSVRAGASAQAAHLHTAFGGWVNVDRDESGQQWTTRLAVFRPERVSSGSAAKSQGWSWPTQSESMERIT